MGKKKRLCSTTLSCIDFLVQEKSVFQAEQKQMDFLFCIFLLFVCLFLQLH